MSESDSYEGMKLSTVTREEKLALGVYPIHLLTEEVLLKSLKNLVIYKYIKHKKHKKQIQNICKKRNIHLVFI